MNRINPIYILMVLIGLLFISYILLQNAKNDMRYSNQEVIHLTKKALNYAQVKKSNTKKHLDNLLKDARYVSSVRKKGNHSNMTITFKHKNQKTVEQFLNKLTNLNVHIQMLKITKNGLELKVSVI